MKLVKINFKAGDPLPVAGSTFISTGDDGKPVQVTACAILGIEWLYVVKKWRKGKEVAGVVVTLMAEMVPLMQEAVPKEGGKA